MDEDTITKSDMTKGASVNVDAVLAFVVILAWFAWAVLCIAMYFITYPSPRLSWLSEKYFNAAMKGGFTGNYKSWLKTKIDRLEWKAPTLFRWIRIAHLKMARSGLA